MYLYAEGGRGLSAEDRTKYLGLDVKLHNKEH